MAEALARAAMCSSSSAACGSNRSFLGDAWEAREYSSMAMGAGFADRSSCRARRRRPGQAMKCVGSRDLPSPRPLGHVAHHRHALRTRGVALEEAPSCSQFDPAALPSDKGVSPSLSALPGDEGIASSLSALGSDEVLDSEDDIPRSVATAALISRLLSTSGSGLAYVDLPRTSSAEDCLSWSALSTKLSEEAAVCASADAVHTSSKAVPQAISAEEHAPLASSLNVVSLPAVLQSEAPPTAKKENGKGDDYYVNVGNAIRTLREELPNLFYKEMSYDIYRDDIVFQDPLNTFQGLKNYKTIFWALRFHGKIFFKALWVDVNRVWQPNERTITIRWSVRGVPRVPWEAWGRFDGTSEYKLDKEGKIYTHKVDNIVMSDPPRYRPLTVVELLQMSGVRQTPGITCFNGAQPAAMGASLAAAATASAMSCFEERPSQEWGGEGCVEMGLERKAGAAAELAGTGDSGAVGGVLGALGMVVALYEFWGKQRAHLQRFTWFRFYAALAGTLVLRTRLQFCS